MNFILVGVILAMLSVVLGAFAAHGLKSRLQNDRIETFQTGAQYQMYHALALITVGIVARMVPSGGLSLLSGAGWLFIVGIVLFSGSLYALSLTGRRALGAITPIGGLCFIVGWLLFAIAAVRL